MLPRSLLGLCSAAAAASLGCGPSDAPRDARGAQGAGGPTPGAGEQVLFRAAAPSASPGIAEEVSRRDPAADEWRTEVLHERAKEALGALLALFLHPEESAPSDSDDLFADDFAGATELRPPLELVFEDGWTRVLRGEPDDELHGREELARIGRALREPFEGTRPHPHFKIVAVELEGPARFATEAVVFVEGEVGERRVQENLRCRVAWESAPDDARVRVRSLRLLAYEEVHSGGPLLGELTEHVLGPSPAFREELVRGVDGYVDRTDRLLGGSFLGMQGIAIADVDGDGLDDLYVPQQAGLPNRLLLHRPDGRVEDATRRSRIGFLEATRSALFVDLDGDGDQDLIAAVGAAIVTAENDGTARFRRFRAWPAERPGDVYSLSAADVDGDGDLDVYCCRYAEQGILYGVPTPYHDADNGATNVFFRNDDGAFVEATDEVGLGTNNRKFSLASVWDDFDDDGDLDLYVANDFGRNNLFRNDGGVFTDVASEVGADDMAAGMGVSAEDFDGDGDVDLHVANMFSSAGLRIARQGDRFMGGRHRDVHEKYVRHARGNTLLANRGDGTFEDVTDRAGISIGGWAWGAKFLDLNNDGLLDVYSPDGFVTNPDPDDM